MRLAIALTGLVLAIAAPAPAAVEIHAHRGGPLESGRPANSENAQGTFERSHAIGADWIELDTRNSADGVVVVHHDPTLDRTTDCTGQVNQRTAAELESCHVNTLGTDQAIREVAGARTAIPRLAAVLEWAKRERVRLNIEINNQPTEPDYDPGSTRARQVLDTIAASGIPRDRVLVQSFWPPNLDAAEAAGFRTSLLTLAGSSGGSIELAAARGYEVLSPNWPVPDAADYVRRAHAAGKAVAPYTFNGVDDVIAAEEAGVDAVISNDVILAQRAIYGVDCPAARAREASRRATLAKARATRNRARGAARVSANASVKRANARRQQAKRLRLRVCTPGA